MGFHTQQGGTAEASLASVPAGKRGQKLFVCRKPLARRVVPKKAAADDVEIKTPFARIKMRSANCTKQAKGGHSK